MPPVVHYAGVLGWDKGEPGSEEAWHKAYAALTARAIPFLIEGGLGMSMSVPESRQSEALDLLDSDPIIRPFLIDPKTGLVRGYPK